MRLKHVTETEKALIVVTTNSYLLNQFVYSNNWNIIKTSEEIKFLTKRFSTTTNENSIHFLNNLFAAKSSLSTISLLLW